MSKIIYLKDILLAKAPKKKHSGRPKLKPFNVDAKANRPTLKSSLVEKNRKDEQRHGGRGEF